MKKLLALVLILSLLSVPALADLPLPEMATEDLIALRDAISQELASRSASADVLASWDTATAHVELVSITRGTTDDGKPGVDLCFRYTNTGSEVDNFRARHWITLYHDGVECERCIRLDGRLVNNDTWGSKVFPGRTLQEMHWFFILPGTEPTVMVEVEDRTGYPRRAPDIWKSLSHDPLQTMRHTHPHPRAAF